jgi:hypothetical protein
MFCWKLSLEVAVRRVDVTEDRKAAESLLDTSPGLQRAVAGRIWFCA